MKSPILLVLTLLLPLGLAADSLRGRLAAGNQAFAEEDYEGAAAAYREAAELDPESPYALFNQGTVAYRAGDWATARDKFQAAQRRAPNAEFEAKCRYNLGNTAFRAAQSQAKPEDGIETCRESIRHFQDARRLDPAHTRAAQNLELSRRQLQILLEQQRQQQEQQQQQQEANDQLKELAERQQQAADRNRQTPNPTPEQQQQMAQEQQQLQQDTEKLAEQHPAQEKLAEAREHQKKAGEKLAEGKPDQAQPSQEKAAQALREAHEQTQQEQQKQQGGEPQEQQEQPEPESPPQQEQQQQGQQQQGEPQNQSDQQAEPQEAVFKNAQDILDRERQNLKNRQLRQAEGLPPVDKNW
ncbi:MAG: tetratricopeptide repeat protein [Lentisphaeria bacterium]|jgi:tetratricopeptide (TPR) repeat protein|nr:tetratricopeptide repeat protein [Lentisphaeria bacterium]